MSPIPLGILAASGAGGGAAAFEQIATTILSSTSTVTFSSIPQTYKHLQIRYTAQSTNASYSANLRMRFNGVTATSYAWHRLFGRSGSVSSGGNSSVDSMFLDEIPAANWGIPIFSAGVIDILDYANTTKNKTAKTLLFNMSGLNPGVGLNSGFLNSTSALSSVTIYTDSNFASGTRFSLYGIKGE